MKILFVDNDRSLRELFNHLNKIDGIHVDFCEDCDVSKDFYEHNKYDIIVINFSLDYGKTILNYILGKNPKQKIITVSENLECSEIKGGDFCQKNFNKVRLLKPVDLSELIKCIKNFDEYVCEYKDKFECKQGLLLIMNEILKRFYGVTYDKATKVITTTSTSSLVDVITLLEEKSIQYQAIANNKIEIID